MSDFSPSRLSFPLAPHPGLKGIQMLELNFAASETTPTQFVIPGLPLR